MDAVTYSKEEVATKLVELFIPLQIDGIDNPELARAFQVDLTPTIVATDARKKVYYRFSGFIGPDEFRHTLSLMRAAVDLEKRNYDEAIALLAKIPEEAFKSKACPEALYMLGVAKYKKSGDFQQAVEQWRKLKLSFPSHPLIKKVDYAL